MVAIGFGQRLALAAGARAAIAFDFAGGVLPVGASLMRGSAGARVNAAGALVAEPVDAARFDHDPVTRALRGLLIEPAATNVLPQSAAATGWTYTNMTRPGVATPAGAPELGVFAMAAGTGIHRIGRAAGDGEGSWTLSAFVRGGVGVPVIGLSREATAWFNTQTGQWLATAGFTAVSAAPLGDGAWRLSASYDLPAGAGTAVYLYACNRAATTPSPGFAGGEECWLGGVQIEAGGSASSAIATGAASASRAGDVLTLDWGARGIGDGPVGARVIFDDGSTQDVALTVSGGLAVLPTALARPRVRRIERI